MNAVPLLSVCIPTFNRLHYLKDALAILMPQAESLGIEVCVSDNHSTDGTANYLRELAETYAGLRYVINPANIGLDGNMLKAISMGEGQYIYPIGDDDFLPEGSLLEILREIETKADVLVLNGWHTTSTLVRKSLHLPATIAGNTYYTSGEAFVALWDKMPFGSFLGSRECFAEKYSGRYVGTSHAYTGAVWDALADIERTKGLCQVRCMGKPTVLLRGGEKTWKKDAALIHLYEIPHWFTLIMEKEAYTKIVPEIRSEFLRKQTKLHVLAQFRAIGQLKPSDVSKLGRECTPEQRRKMMRIAVMPKAFARLLAKTLGKLL